MQKYNCNNKKYFHEFNKEKYKNTYLDKMVKIVTEEEEEG
jgi:hypothetical protein